MLIRGTFWKLVLASLLVTPLFPAQISGNIKDPSGAAVGAAQVEVEGPRLAAAIDLQSDAQGHFQTNDLPPGTYTIRVTKPGFEVSPQAVVLKDEAIALEFKLAVTAKQEQVTVTGKVSAGANTDPVYLALRRVGLGRTVVVENVRFTVDVGSFELRKGTLTWLNPVNGEVTGAVFVGEGSFSLQTVTPMDALQLRRWTEGDAFQEDIRGAVFRFTNGQRSRFPALSEHEVTLPQGAQSFFSDWQDEVRHRREEARSFTDAMLTNEGMDNVDADLLSCLYNPKHPGFFNAYMRGRKHTDLRFSFRPRTGAIPGMDSSEEVALINHAPDSLEDGIYYLSHTREELTAKAARSDEERRMFAPRKLTLETVIGNNDHLTALATVEFESLWDGERVAKFSLLPNLRVTRVTDAQGTELSYVQESRKDDGSFYVILPRGGAKGTVLAVKIEYSGDKVIYKAGEGSFYVRARESWYPNLNGSGFGNRTLFDLTYKVPKKYRVISVGNLEKEWTEDNFAVSHWVTPTPVAVAGFNFGAYKKMEITDDKTGSTIDGFYLPELPDSLRQFEGGALSGMAPSAMTKHALEETRAQLEVCNYFFGKDGFDRIYITEQPDFNFGQSWPNLVYLPIAAYMDSTQRWRLMGSINSGLSAFVEEVTPHEVAHQWWGHAVGWSSYHDQWLSEGFAEFSAALFVQTAHGTDWEKDYIKMWDRLRKRLLEKNEFGSSPNDAGPLWLGLRLISPKNANAYVNVTYPKGAFVLAMLRSVMYTRQDGDKAFIETMRDFVDTHRDHPASTESFKKVVEKHMTKALDLDHNGKMDWFFNDWVYGMQIPKYSLTYEVSPAGDGKFKLHMTISQQGVDNSFIMAVPVFLDPGKGKGLMRLGQMPLRGSNSDSVDVVLPFEPKNVLLNPYHEILERN